MPAKIRPQYVLISDADEYYLFWDKVNYGEPTFSRDPYWAKKMTAQGCGSATKMLKTYGINVQRKLVSEVEGKIRGVNV